MAIHTTWTPRLTMTSHRAHKNTYDEGVHGSVVDEELADAHAAPHNNDAKGQNVIAAGQNSMC